MVIGPPALPPPEPPVAVAVTTGLTVMMDAPEGTLGQRNGPGDISQDGFRPITPNASAGLRQAMGIHVQERDPGFPPGKPALVQEVAGPRASLQVVGVDVRFKEPSKQGRGSLPGKVIADAKDPCVIGKSKNEWRINCC